MELRHGKTGKLLANPLDLKAFVGDRPGSLTLTSDGKTLALAGNSDIYLCAAEGASTPRKLSAPMAHNGPAGAAPSLCFAPGDKELLVGIASDLQLFDVQTLQEIKPSDGHRGRIDHVAFAPDGKRLFTGLGGRNQATGEAFGPNGEVYYFVTSTRGGLPSPEQAVWDVSSWQRLQLTSAHTVSWPNYGSASLQQSIYVGKAGQESLTLFDMKSGQPLERMMGFGNLPGVGFFSPGGKHFVHYVRDGRPDLAERIYSVASGKLVCQFLPVIENPNRGAALSMTPGDSSDNIAFSPDEKLVAQYGRGDGMIRVYDTVTGTLRHTLGKKPEVDPMRPFINVHHAVAFSADNRLLVSWSGLERLLRVWEVSSGAELAEIPHGDSSAASVNSPNGRRQLRLAFSPDSRLLAVAETKIRVWEMATLSVRRELSGHADATVRALAFAPASGLLASASSDTTVLVWDLLYSGRPPQEGGRLEQSILESHWKKLAADDAGAAYAALLALVSSPADSLPWIKERLARDGAIDPKRIRQLIGDLNDSQFKVRQSATTELLQIGSRGVPAIDEALASSPSLEMHRRLHNMRKSMTSPVLKGDKLRAFRAIETLEKIGTAEARTILQSLTAGAVGGPVTTQARDALARLGR